MVTGPNPRRSRQRHLSSSTVDRPHLAFTQRISALPSSLQALDLHLSVRMDIPSALASLRTHVLSYLSDLEARLALLDFQSSILKSPTDSKFNETESSGQESDHPDVQLRDLDLSVEDIGAFVRQGVELLQSIRADVCSYLPDDFDFGASTSHALRNHLLDFDVRSKFPDFGMPTMGHLRSRISEISPISPLCYIPTLKAHLSRLQNHLQNHQFSIPSNRTFPLPSISPPKVLSELFAILLQEDTEETIEEDIKKARQEEETMHEQVKRALVKSQHGYHLIRFEDLPHKWRNNEFVHTGYRFIPAKSWPLLLGSIFQLHNETLNIHTHLVPMLSLISLAWPFLPNMLPAPFASMDTTWTRSTFSHIPTLLPSNPTLDLLPSMFFTLSATCCLLSSVVWHLFAGCSDELYVESAACGDYVGIGWLIAASVQSVVYYGFNCQTTHLRVYTALCILTGLAGSVFPFQAWFNERRHKKWRIVFFLGLCFASILPLTHLSLAKGPLTTLMFIHPVIPSCLSYLVGLVFYASHFPECHFPGMFDWGHSHALWHIFIVIAVRSHYQGMGVLKMESATFSCSSM